MSLSKLAFASLTAVTMSLAFVSTASNAHAQCGMGEDVDFYATERKNVAQAEDLLRQGEPKKAAWLLQQTWPRMREAVPREGSLSVIADGVRVMALAVVRADGDVRSDLGWSSWTPAERASNVAWGISRLRMLTTTESWNTDAKANLGEALARAPETRDEARGILEALDRTGGMSSPEGYAALAFVRTLVGDTAGADRASRECERRARTEDTDINRCIAAGGRVTPVVTASR